MSVHYCRLSLQLYRFLSSILYTILYRLVFLLGETNDEKDQIKLEEEAHTYGDIVQVGAYSRRLLLRDEVIGSEVV
jgi:hypothetical protein